VTCASRALAVPKPARPLRHSLALVQRERLLERICLGVYALIDAKLIAKLRRATFGTWLRVSLAKQRLAVFAKYGVIQASFKPVDLGE
jgi:hypothetical protein